MSFKKKPLTSSLDHLNGKTKFKKVGPPYDLLKGKEAKVISWILGMQDYGFSITLQCSNSRLLN
jgi:hypothetical protein